MQPESNKPLISIVTPVYNAERFLEKTLNSVLSQTYPHWEQWLVIDANCTDRSLEVAQKFAAQDARIRVLNSPENRGVVKNRNAALDASQGDFIAFLDADDIWLPEKLEVQLKFMMETRTRFSCHSFVPIDENENVSGPPRKPPSEADFEQLLGNNTVGCLSVMVRKDFLGNRRFKDIKHEDMDLWLQLLRDGEKVRGLPQNLAYYRVLSTSYSGNKLKSALWRWGIYRAQGISVFRSLILIAKYVISAVQKRV